MKNKNGKKNEIPELLNKVIESEKVIIPNFFFKEDVQKFLDYELTDEMFEHIAFQANKYSQLADMTSVTFREYLLANYPSKKELEKEIKL